MTMSAGYIYLPLLKASEEDLGLELEELNSAPTRTSKLLVWFVLERKELLQMESLVDKLVWSRSWSLNCEKNWFSITSESAKEEGN